MLDYAVHNYTIVSDVDQVITVVAVPLALDTVNILYVNLLSNQHKAIDGTNTMVDSNLYINFIQFTAHAQDSFVVQVMPSSTSLTGQYRLYVTGSSAYLNQFNFKGSYLHTIQYSSH